jgi:hypothetical protein
MALRRCAWCGKSLGSGPGPEDTETHGVCEGCETRLDADTALGHALVGVRAITAGLERATDDHVIIADGRYVSFAEAGLL